MQTSRGRGGKSLHVPSWHDPQVGPVIIMDLLFAPDGGQQLATYNSNHNIVNMFYKLTQAHFSECHPKYL